MKRFDEEDEEYVELVKEYERFIRDHRYDRVDFDEWLEDYYGESRKRVIKPKRLSPKEMDK